MWKNIGRICDVARKKKNFRLVRKIAKSDNELRHVRPSVRMEQLGSDWTDFHVI
jgi:hypothetical protein